MKRATGINELLNKNIECFDFDGDFFAAFDKPEKTGSWFIWGNSGNGKTSFTIQLAKYLTRFERVAYNSLEEGGSKTMQNAFNRVKMQDVDGKLVLLSESIDTLDKRMSKKRSPKIVIIDSFQYARMNEKKYFSFMERHGKNKLIIFISQADGKQPRGNTAITAMYAASLKIWVEGYRAFSKGRYFGTKAFYEIWQQKANEYWLN